MYIKTTNGNVDTYPYNVGQLRRDNPNTSFPKKVPDEVLAEWGVYPVTVEDQPSYAKRTQLCTRNAQPVLTTGAWTVGWTVTDKTQEEVQAYDDNVATSNRSTRDSLLSKSDWTQVSDAPVDATAWATYRQALRDITSHANWPNLVDADWPTKP
tara:strand:- start:46 stop:507 length:462 start_codon:yes stop_codon:yes gene_type:complete